MVKLRVYELAQELGFNNQAMVKVLQDIGFEIRGVMSTLEENEVEVARRLLSKRGATIASHDQRLIAASAVAPLMPRAQARSIGWLHLSDLHQGMTDAGWLWPNVLAQAFEDLGRLHEHSGPWDVVFFTGDLTQRGDPKEFENLNETLTRLWKHFARLGSNPRLVCVPGNHDLARPGALDPVTLALSRWHELPALRAYVLGAETNPYRERLRELFSAYTTWRKESPWFPREGLTEGVMPGDFSLSLSLNGIDLGIVGLNTAFLQLTGEDFYGRLDVDPRQLHRVCDHYPPEWIQKHHINLLLTHHPPDWLAADAKQTFHQEIDPAGRFLAHFFGHMHEGIVTSISHGGGPPRHSLQGASLFGLEAHEGVNGRSQRIHGYSAGRFELLSATNGAAHIRVRVYPRRMFMSSSGRRIERDVQNYQLDDRGSFTFDAPASKGVGFA